MTPATSNLRPAAEIVAALTAQLAALELSAGIPLLQRIERFDVESLTEAFRLLLISEQRICIIVVLTETYEPILEGRRLMLTRSLPIALLISDRLLGDRVKALWGDPDDATVPGALALAARALPAVTGQLLESDADGAGVLSRPLSTESIFLRDEDRQDLPGRAAVVIELQCSGGTIAAPVQPGGNL